MIVAEESLDKSGRAAPSGLAYTWHVAQDFPELPDNVIDRPQLLETIAEILSSDTPVVFLEGEEGYGATTTLSQFCRKYPDQSFSLFIKPASKFAYSKDYLQLVLAEQFYWHLHAKSLPASNLDESEYRSLFLEVRRKAKGRHLYFIVDGLHRIPAADEHAIAQIFEELLFIGVDCCRFIITGQQTTLARKLKGGVKSKPYQQLRFHPDESRRFLRDAGITESDCNRVHQLCGGIPGRLAVVRRLLLSGTSLSSILEIDPGKYLEFVKLEFSKLLSMDEPAQLVAASVAFAKMGLATQDLASLLQMEVSEVEEIIASCQFLTVTASRQVEYISETHRKFAASQLEQLGRKALTAQLEYLGKNPASEASLRFLPAYLESLNQQEAILDLLSKEHYSDLLDSTQSFSALRARAEIGARSATNLRKTHEVFKFALQRSIFASMSADESDSSRVRALVAMGKPSTALSLANAEATKEDRLALLSAYARRVKERAGEIDKEVLALIEQLMLDIDFRELGDRAIRIAADVLIFDADRAIGIIDAAVKGASVAKRDAALAELSISASISKLRHRTTIDDKAQSLISDAALQEVTHSFALLASRLDPMEVISTLSKMPAAHRIFFLTSFVGVRKADPSVLDLVEYGLDTIISEAEYTPRAKDLAELCAPFHTETNDLARMRRLVDRFDSQLGLVGRASHSKDFAVLQMRLAAGEYQYDRRSARDRVEQTYYDVTEVKTPEARLECLAWMLKSLTQIDQDGELERQDGFRAVVKADLNELLDRILQDTADHLAAVMPALKVLAADDHEAALTLAGKLNTEERRDSAFAVIASVLISQPYSESALKALERSLNLIISKNLRSKATLDLLGKLDSNVDRARWLPQTSALRSNLITAKSQGMWDVRIFKASLAAKLDVSIDSFITGIDDIAGRSESPLDEIRLCFQVAEALAPVEPDIAKTYYEKGTTLKEQEVFGTPTTLKLFELCLSLVGRAIAPLARENQLDDDKLVRYLELIGLLPGILAKVCAYSEFAERLYCVKRKDIAERVIQERIRPLLEQSRLLELSIYQKAIAIAFPAYAATQLSVGLSLLESLEPEMADDAIQQAAVGLRLRKLPFSEPQMNGKSDYSKVEDTDLFDVIELMKKISEDGSFYTILRAFVEAVIDKQNRNKFTAAQKADWATNLRAMIDLKLPDQKNIKHIGYKVVALARTACLVETTTGDWKRLEQLTESINNTADKGYVYLTLAGSLPSKYRMLKETYLSKALESIEGIPSPLDRLSRFHEYAQEAFAQDAVASARETLKRAMRLSIEIEDSARFAHHRRELIDLADQIDSTFADELIDLVDDDPARAAMKLDSEKANALVKARRELANAKRPKDAQQCNAELLPSAAWKNLAALEAGRLETKPIEVMLEYVSVAGNGTLYDAYPVLSWHLENMARKFRTVVDVKQQLTPVCESLLLTTELAHLVIGKIARQSVSFTEEEQEDGILVRRRDREEAIGFIEQWLMQNAREYLVLCDPYFSPADVSLLRLFLGHAPQCKVFVLAGKHHLTKQKALSDEVFRRAWREQCEQDPPETKVIALAYSDSDRNVIHDRWLITKGAGLRFGTSFNSLGDGKLSEISVVAPGRLPAIEEQIHRYLHEQRTIDGARIQYMSFTLD